MSNKTLTSKGNQMSKSLTSTEIIKVREDHNFCITYPARAGYQGDLVPMFGTMMINTDADLTQKQINEIGLKWFDSLIDILPDGAALEVEDDVIARFRAK